MNTERLPITVLVQTKNEERGVAACLEQLRDFSEVVVVDSYSSDRTRDISKEHGVRVELFKWNGQYPKKKQWQLDNLEVSNSWILFLDADEAPSKQLIDELRDLHESGVLSTASAFDVPLDYHFLGRSLRFGHKVHKRVLLRKDFCKFPEIDDLSFPGMGELEGHYQPLVRGRILRLKNKLIHNDLDPLTTWFDRHNRYSDWEARLMHTPELANKVAELKTNQGKFFAKLPFKPVLFFAYSYFLRLGFLDGYAGFTYAVALSFYYWQIRVKRFEIQRRELSN